MKTFLKTGVYIYIHTYKYIYIYNFTEVQVSRVIIVLLLQNCFVWCKDHTHQAILMTELSRALYEIRSTQKTNIYIYIYIH